MGVRVGVLTFTLVLAGCASEPTVEETPVAQAVAADEPGLLALEFDEVIAEFGTVIAGAQNRGTAQVRTSVTTLNGGRIRLGPGTPGGAAVFPAFTGAEQSPAAALVVHPAGPTDVLEPRNGGFAFGARFRLDRETGESGGAGNDDGNNLIQRGLFESEAQYKIQVDSGIPSCRVAGSAGATVVEMEEPVVPDRWYAIECSRDGDEVALRLSEVDGDLIGTASVRSATGELRFGDGVPLTVGAKVAPDGTIPQLSTDQLNGTIDGAFYRELP